MKKIKLGKRNLFAIVDNADFERVAQFRWHFFRMRGSLTIYARGWINGKAVLMHRFILGSSVGRLTDHKDGNGLNNRRRNLRSCSPKESSRNMPVQKNRPFKGIYFRKERPYGKMVWRAHIRVSNQLIVLGHFKSAVEAALAYDKAAIKFFGSFARLNFPRYR